MNKETLLTRIEEENLKLDQWGGKDEEIISMANRILVITKDTVQATDDSPIYHPTFDQIAANIANAIRFDHKNLNRFAKTANEFLKILTPLALPDSVNNLRQLGVDQERSLAELDRLIKDGNEEILQHNLNAKKQREEHDEEMKRITRSHNQQLEFEIPLRTWVKASKKYDDRGIVFMRLLIGLTILSVVSLTVILLNTPDEVLKLFSQSDKSAAVRWSFTFLLLVGFLAYSIRAMARAMFSSFHLARDADERALLTKYYLGLIRKGALEDNDRTIVMQSLFSRSDTGLLKDDGSPTMAGDLIAKMKK